MNNGGPAFPNPIHKINFDTTPRMFDEEGRAGMSLRDWFAGMALQGILANPQISPIIEMAKEKELDSYDYAALASYSIADAMLKYWSSAK